MFVLESQGGIAPAIYVQIKITAHGCVKFALSIQIKVSLKAVSVEASSKFCAKKFYILCSCLDSIPRLVKLVTEKLVFTPCLLDVQQQRNNDNKHASLLALLGKTLDTIPPSYRCGQMASNSQRIKREDSAVSDSESLSVLLS